MSCQNTLTCGQKEPEVRQHIILTDNFFITCHQSLPFSWGPDLYLPKWRPRIHHQIHNKFITLFKTNSHITSKYVILRLNLNTFFIPSLRQFRPRVFWPEHPGEETTVEVCALSRCTALKLTLHNPVSTHKSFN